MDSYFASPALFCALLSENTLACGTVSVTKAGMPETLKSTKLTKDETVYRSKGELLARKWHDKCDGSSMMFSLKIFKSLMVYICVKMFSFLRMD